MSVHSSVPGNESSLSKVNLQKKADKLFPSGCKKSKKVICTMKHIVDEMWKQWRIEGGKEKGKENADDEEETTLSKVDEKGKFKGKDCSKDKDNKRQRRKRLTHATTAE